MPVYDTGQFFRERGLQKPGLIEDDRCCLGCGYQLRGLREGHRCPECGRPITALQGQGLSEVPTGLLRRLARMLALGWLAWATGMAMWFWIYYGWFFRALYMLAPMMIIFNLTAILGGIRVWSAIEESQTLAQRRVLTATRWLVAVGSVLLVLLVVARTLWTGVMLGGAFVGLATLTALCWLGVQTLACTLLQRLAIAGHDNQLADRLGNVIWAIGLSGAFVTPFFGVTQMLVLRSGVAPTCCWGGYLFVVGLLIAQVVFCHALLRLHGMVRWSIKYRNQYDAKTARMVDRIDQARTRDGGESPVFIRDDQ